jgi:quinoprotein relay system zinc metallohydrolase 2
MLALRWGLCYLATLCAPSFAQTVASTQPFALERIAEGVYVHRGVVEQVSPANQGDIANLGVVIGERCIAVIDSGGSPSVGRAFREAIRALSPKPVCYVINTHVHPDHLLGNVAFQADAPAFVAHHKLAASLAARARTYTATVSRELGVDVTAAHLVPPTQPATGDTSLDLGGRTLKLTAWPTAHTDHDLTVFDESSGTLFLGDLAFADHLPVVDGSIKGWVDVLAAVSKLPAKIAIPGHGTLRGAWPQSLDTQRSYLVAVRDEVRAAIKAGTSLQKAVDSVGWAAAKPWKLVDFFHRRNVTAAYAELEWE